eukprot:4876414-Amphidinium_carterae.1
MARVATAMVHTTHDGPHYPILPMMLRAALTSELKNFNAPYSTACQNAQLLKNMRARGITTIENEELLSALAQHQGAASTHGVMVEVLFISNLFKLIVTLREYSV